MLGARLLRSRLLLVDWLLETRLTTEIIYETMRGGLRGYQKHPKRPKKLLKHLHKVTNSQLLYIGVG